MFFCQSIIFKLSMYIILSNIKESNMLSQKVFIVALDSGAIITDFNDAASRISGYSKDEVIGKNWFEIFIPDRNLLEVLQVFSDLFQRKDYHWEHTNVIVCKNKTKKTIKWMNNIITDNKNRPRLIYSLGLEVIN